MTKTPQSLPPIWLMGAFGFVSGLPLPLSGFTLRYWLSESGVSLQAIGLTAAVGLSYTLKFLWAPLLDQAQPFARSLGRRRGWLITIQPLLALACILLALGDPSRDATAVAAAAVLVAFLSATQDIAIDAWRIENFPPAMQGLALAAYVWGYRVAMLVSGAGAIGLVGWIGWHGALLTMAVLTALGMATTLLAPETKGRIKIPGTGWRDRMTTAVILPFRDLLSRAHAIWILAFVLLFKLGEALASTMAAPFYRAMGFDRAAVALATGVPSLAASLAGAAFGGWLVIRLGPGRALVLTGFVQMASMFLYFALAASGGNPIVLYAKVILEAFAEAMADAAFLTFLSNLCSRQFTATQYALLSSFAALGLRTVASTAGFLADALGWISFYGLTIFAALPAMLIMLKLMRLEKTSITA
jgi:PAT family beta-lactamase induction signal transducer AmpG